MSSDIRQKFGLDYLVQHGTAPRISQDDKLEREVVTVGGEIVELMKHKPRKSVRLHELVNVTDTDLDTLLPVVQRLENLGIIRYAIRDKIGNHEIELTEQ